ncbi:MAG: metallophosphoesterase [Gallionella sp.]
MKLHILSDIHLEFSAFEPPRPVVDVVVLAGDIAHASQGIQWARNTFADQPVVYVPGNHEFYRADRPETLAAMRIAARENGIHLLDEDEVVIQTRDGQERVRVLGCTLWTDFCLFGEKRLHDATAAGEKALADFRIIREGSGRFTSGRFTPERSIELHKQALAWLKGMLNTPFDGKTVVVTHHLPSSRSVADRYKADLVSACFASELDYLFGKMSLWVHGHTHDSFDYEANGTRVVCNPRGYVTARGAENLEFNPGLVVDI